jgi:hypothetical protein
MCRQSKANTHKLQESSSEGTQTSRLLTLCFGMFLNPNIPKNA